MECGGAPTCTRSGLRTTFRPWSSLVVVTAVGVGLPVSATAEAAMKRARDDDGLGDSDFSAVYEAQKKVKPS